MKVFLTLLRREYWEHRSTLFWLPIFTGAALILLSLLFLSTMSWHFDIKNTLASTVQEAEVMTIMAALFIRLPFMLVLWFSILVYALNTLYEERKDKSILFWRSLPISDEKTVLAKLFTALITFPIIYIIMLMLTQVIILGLAQIALWYHHVPFTFSPTALGISWMITSYSLLLQSLLLFPLICWLLLASEMAARAPILYATMPIVLLCAAELILLHTNNFFLALHRYGAAVLDVPMRLKDLALTLHHSNYAAILGYNDNANLNMITNSVLIYFLIGLILLGITIKVRNRAK